MTGHAGALLLLPLLPLLVASVLLLAGRMYRGAAPGNTAWLTGFAGAALGLEILVALLAARVTLSVPLAWWGPRLNPQLAVEGLSRVMVVLVPTIALPVVLYAGTSSRTDATLPRLLALLVGFTGAMELLVVAGDFLTLLIAWELVGACSWGLIGFEWRDPARPRAARAAYLTTRFGDLGLYIAAAAAFGAAGSLRFDALRVVEGAPLAVVATGVLVAAAAKSGQLPFSPWLFSAMAGPTPASALLHSATMVASGAYLLARLEPVLSRVDWFGPTVALLGLATALAGGVVASVQGHLKRALAASTSAQYGLMLVAIGAGRPAAAGLHLVTHAAFKALLFLGAGVAAHAAGSLELRALRAARLGRALPRVSLLFAIGTLALAGAPPLGAAYSKEQILAAAAHLSRNGGWLATGVLVSSLLSAFYAGRLQLLAFAPAAEPIGNPAAAPSRAERVSLGLLALLSVALGVLWFPGASRMLVRTVGGGTPAAGAAWELPASLAALITGLALCWLLASRGALLGPERPPWWHARVANWFGLSLAARHLVVVPVLTLARTLARADDRVVDAGVRAAARIGAFGSRALAWWAERGIEGIVRAVTRTAAWASRLSWHADDRALDRSVEDLARGTDWVGNQSRRLQSGLAHHYYLLLAAGVLLAIGAAAAAVFGPAFLPAP